MIIDLCYIWGEKWVAIYDEGNNCWVIVMIIVSIFLYCVTIFLFYREYQWFGGDSCGSQKIWISISAFLVLILTILTVSPIPEQKSIITSGAVSLYVAYLTWSALTNSTADVCNDFFDSNSSLTIQIAIGTFIFVIALFYVSYQTSGKTSEKVKITGNVNIVAEILDDDEEDDEPYEEEEKEEEEENDEDEEDVEDSEEKKKKSHNKKSRKEMQDTNEEADDHLRSYMKSTWINFHCLMVIGSIYISMLMTNWAAQDLSQDTFASFTPNDLSMWVKLAAAWITALIYMWTCVAARVLGTQEVVQQPVYSEFYE